MIEPPTIPSNNSLVARYEQSLPPHPVQLFSAPSHPPPRIPPHTVLPFNSEGLQQSISTLPTTVIPPKELQISEYQLEKLMSADIDKLLKDGWSTDKLQLINFFMDACSPPLFQLNSFGTLHKMFTKIGDREIEKRLTTKSKR